MLYFRLRQNNEMEIVDELSEKEEKNIRRGTELEIKIGSDPHRGSR